MNIKKFISKKIKLDLRYNVLSDYLHKMHWKRGVYTEQTTRGHLTERSICLPHVLVQMLLTFYKQIYIH